MIRTLAAATAVAATLLAPAPAIAAPTGAAVVAAPIHVAVPRVPADANGVPLERCGPATDGRKVETEDAVGGRHRFTCHHRRNLIGPDEWVWLEILAM
ncbi:hypothetical protein [Nocardia wallacei]|uniref:Secreted protein n=1 Tax=Nocardia wallacei TaxID=480035 RepID=A0A7G1KW62_9NOCA|nr:hypothetical protein [Nocardia wallacei]BCK58423.1 hypothetical protein NWFMUON74_61950 [Nocardia wallacei]